MSRAKGPAVEWHLLDLDQLERHAASLKAIGLSQTAAFTRALRKARADATSPEGGKRRDALAGPVRP